jgi:hypothetical protein
LIRSPKKPPELDFRNWYTGAVNGPFTSTCFTKLHYIVYLHVIYSKLPDEEAFSNLIKNWKFCFELGASKLLNFFI